MAEVPMGKALPVTADLLKQKHKTVNRYTESPIKPNKHSWHSLKQSQITENNGDTR